MTTTVATNPRRRFSFSPLTLTVAAATAVVSLIIISQARSGEDATVSGDAFLLPPSDGVPMMALTEAHIIAEHEALIAGWLETS